MNDKKVHDTADSISQTMREIFETTENNTILRVNETLNKTSGGNYFVTQQQQRLSLKKQLEKDIAKSIDILKEANHRASQIAGIDPAKFDKKIERQTALLITGAMRKHMEGVRKIVRLEKIRPLKEAIFMQTQRGIGEGLKVKTKSGFMGYKEYMEMNVRTTLQTEIGEQQLKYNQKAGVVFYITNHFADCADDHKDYQGRIYYDKRYKTFGIEEELVAKIDKKIQRDNLLSVQEVRDKSPFLTTRPNCRHHFTPISIEDGLGVSRKQLMKDLNLSTGSYKKENYKDMQEQRYNERQIRHYKARKEMNEKMYAQTKDKNYLLQSKKDAFMVRKWQKKQRELIERSQTLERDYRRETRNVILKDLGAKYNQLRG